MHVGTGTRAIVSGATRGIGRATARALAERGARVGLMARDESELKTLEAELPGSMTLQADVADRKAVEAAVAAFAEEAGGLDLAVANAGIAEIAAFADLDPDRAEQMIAVNLTGTLNLVRSALPHLLDTADGHIVVVSSSAGLRAFPWAAVYGATKAAQRAFAEALRHELSGSGVSVSTIYPGEVKTSLHAHEHERMPDWYRPTDAIPPELVADAIVDAVDQDRRETFVPGQVRLLGLNGVAPSLVDRLLAVVRGGSAAPRRY